LYLSCADDGIRRPIGLREDEADVSLEMLISGTSLVQVLVSDRFHGAAAEPLPVDVPHRSPQSAILGPVDGSTVRTDANVRLRGVATASYGRDVGGVPGDRQRPSTNRTTRAASGGVATPTTGLQHLPTLRLRVVLDREPSRRSYHSDAGKARATLTLEVDAA
jgi:hypothetical protein